MHMMAASFKCGFNCARNAGSVALVLCAMSACIRLKTNDNSLLQIWYACRQADFHASVSAVELTNHQNHEYAQLQ